MAPVMAKMLPEIHLATPQGPLACGLPLRRSGRASRLTD